MSDDKKLLQRVVTEQGQFLDHQLAPTMSNMKIGLYRVFTLPKFKKWVEIVATMSSTKNSLYRVYTGPKFKK